MAKSAILKSSLAKKYLMALTGLFLCLFLIGHLAGNLQLLLPFSEDARTQFNAYAQFMSTNPLIQIVAWLTKILIIFHVVDGLWLTFENKKARPVKYAHSKPNTNSKWYSRQMALLGTILLAFIIVHLVNFWGRMHYTEMPMQGEMKDLYAIVIEFFKTSNLAVVWVIIYVVSMAAVGFHLAHGFKSAAQSLGINHKKYNKIIAIKSLWIFGILIPVLFAIIPLYIYFVMDVDANLLNSWIK